MRVSLRSKIPLAVFLFVTSYSYFLIAYGDVFNVNDDSEFAFVDEKYEIVSTNYGWTTPNGHDFSRRILTGEFFNAVLAHPRYNGTAWAHLDQNPDPSRPLIAVMDVDTCMESNYPTYGVWEKGIKGAWKVNIEEDHPVPGPSAVGIAKEACPYLKKAALSPALTSHNDSRLIVIDCSGCGNWDLRSQCNHDPTVFQNNQVIVANYCATKNGPPLEVGLPPPAIKPVNLTATERGLIKQCNKRKYLFSFQGRHSPGSGREGLIPLQNDTDFYIQLFDTRQSFQNDFDSRADDAKDSNNFKGTLKNSVFAGAPRGDIAWSYRFSEILSAGAVPVVYSDTWRPPFNDRVVNWTKCAVFIPEDGYDKTADILRSIPEDVRCEMQQCALNVWDRYASNRAGWLRALIAVARSTISAR